MSPSLGKGCVALLVCAGMAFYGTSCFAMPISQYPGGGRERVTARIDAPYAAFFENGRVLGSVEVDGQPLEPDKDYRHKGGGIVIELTPDFLETLSPGTYPITVTYEGGTAESSFTVGVGEAVPSIRDDSNPLGFLLGASLMALIAVSLLERRRKEQEAPEGVRAGPG